jgi:hypothetical protein
MTVTLIRGLIQRADTSAQASPQKQTTLATAPESQAASAVKSAATLGQLQSAMLSDAAVVRLSTRAQAGNERIRDYDKASRESDRLAEKVVSKAEEAEGSHRLGSEVAKSHLSL